MADPELDARLPRPTGVLALEEVAEEAPLKALAVARIEALPGRAAVRREPLVARGGPRVARSHLSREAACTTPSKLPRVCSPCPPQLAAERNGVLIFDQSGERARHSTSSSGWSSR